MLALLRLITLWPLLGVVALAGCQSTAAPLSSIPQGKPVALSAAYQRAVRVKILSVLKDPDSARFGPMRGGESDGTVVVCGTVNARNSFGGYSGPRPYHGVILDVHPKVTPSFILGRIASTDSEAASIAQVCLRRGAPI